MVIGLTVGLPSRTVSTPFSVEMKESEHARIADGMKLGDRKSAFEHDNMGSLLIGAKGFIPDFENDPKNLIHLEDDDIYKRGNFCVGDSLAFFQNTCTIDAIHDRYFATKDVMAKTLDRLEIMTRPDHEIFDEIAIVGMGCVLPDAHSPKQLWQNILEKRSAIRKMPESRMNRGHFYNPDKAADDKTYTEIAGVIEDFVFDGTPYGIKPEHADKISRSQQLVITATAQAVLSAGYGLEKALPKSTAVIIASCLGNELINNVHMKYFTPEIRSEIKLMPEFAALSEEEQNTLLEALKVGLAGETKNEPPDTAVLNIEASRVAALLDVEGPNYVVDAACATSFAAIDCGIRELRSGAADAVVTGGLNTSLSPETFVGFSNMGALSADGSFPFDERANGFVLGEGAGVFVLKRMRDAVRDGDPILAVIKGMGASSDGKGKAIAAPNPKGQLLALERCYENAITELDPREIGFVEAHGTSTIMGDKVEMEVLKEFYGKEGKVGVSSVKSQVGHLLGGAGAAGLLKGILALNHKTLATKRRIRETGSRPRGRQDRALCGEGRPGVDRCRRKKPEGGHFQLRLRRHQLPLRDRRIHRCRPAGGTKRIPGSRLGSQRGPDCRGRSRHPPPRRGFPRSLLKKLETGESMLTENPELGFDADEYAEEDREYRIHKVKAGVVKNFKFNNVKYRIPPKSAAYIDRSQLFALTATDQAVQSSGLGDHLGFGNRIGVMVGTISGTRNVENILRTRMDLLHELLSVSRASPRKPPGPSPTRRSPSSETGFR